MLLRQTRRLITSTVIGLAALFVAQPVWAAPYTWSGLSGTSALWSASNWLSGTLPTSGTHSLFFTGSNRLTNTAGTNYAIDGITFQSGAQSFTLQGNSSTRTLAMFGDIVNQSGLRQTIGGTTTGTKLVLAYGTATATRTIDTGSGEIDVNAAITGGANVTIVKTGLGNLVIDNPPGTGHNFSGTFAIDQGKVDLQATFNANVEVSGSATLNVNPTAGGISTATVNSLTSSGTVNMIGNLTVNEAVTLDSTSVVNFTLPVDPNETTVLSYGAGSTFGGTLNATLLGDYPDADLFNPTVFQILQSTAGDPAGNFNAVTANYNGQTLTFAQGLDPSFPQKWVSGTTSTGQYLTFDQVSGEMVVVPEPSTVVFAGIGAAMAGWHMLKEKRRRRLASRPTFEV
jgi:hypothetical protein